MRNRNTSVRSLHTKKKTNFSFKNFYRYRHFYENLKLVKVSNREKQLHLISNLISL